MSLGGIAAIIAALAFVVLVIFLVRVLSQVSKTVEKVETTVTEANTTIDVLTKDVDLLMQQVEGLLVKGNHLLNDINGKVETIDPLFTAVADLSESVSALNTTSRNLAGKVGTVGKGAAKASVAGKVGATTMRFFRDHKSTTNAKTEG